jgi:hypothetical protein
MEYCKDLYGSLKLFTTYDGTNKGLIVDENNEELVPYFPSITDVVISQANPDQFTFPISAYESTESSLIRVYFYHHHWTLSTSTKIQADESHWSEPKSFTELFEEALQRSSNMELDEFLQLLEVGTVYYFLLPTTGLNRIGKLEDPTETLQLAGVYKDKHLYIGETLNDPIERIIPSVRAQLFHTWKEFEDAVNETAVGYLLLESQTRYVNRLYYRRFELRNNQPNIYRRFIYLVKSGSDDEREIIIQMYPQLEKEVCDTVKDLHQRYVQRFIHKVFETEPQPVHRILVKCHEHYVTTRSPIQLEDVRQVLFGYSIGVICDLVFR